MYEVFIYVAISANKSYISLTSGWRYLICDVWMLHVGYTCTMYWISLSIYLSLSLFLSLPLSLSLSLSPSVSLFSLSLYISLPRSLFLSPPSSPSLFLSILLCFCLCPSASLLITRSKLFARRVILGLIPGKLLRPCFFVHK